MQAKQGLFPTLALLSACAASVAQVPRSQPHGVVHFRIVHRDTDAAHEDSIRLDAQVIPVGRGEGDPLALRVSPGLRYVELTSRGVEYALRTRDVDKPAGCVGQRCEVLATAKQPETRLEESGVTFCEQALDLDVRVGAELLALLVVGPGDKCTACAVEDLTARECPVL